MLNFGPNGYFIHLILFSLPIVIFGFYRLSKRKYEDNPDSTFTPLPREITPLGIELDPSTGTDLSNSEKQMSVLMDEFKKDLIKGLSKKK